MKRFILFIFIFSITSTGYSQTCPETATFLETSTPGVFKLFLDFGVEAEADFWVDGDGTCTVNCNQLTAFTVVGSIAPSGTPFTSSGGNLNDATGGATAQSLRLDGNNNKTTVGGSFVGTVTLTHAGGTLSCVFGAPLPIELISFQAHPRDNSVQLKWETASEVDNDYMIVEKSLSGFDFKEIGRIKGAGTSFAVSNYSFEDSSPVNAMNYYRLKQVDYDGTSEYSKVISVNFRGKTITDKLVLFPTIISSGQNLQIDLSKYEGNLKFKIHNSIGQIVKNLTVETGGIIAISTENFDDGIYYITTSGRRFIETAQFFISNK